MRRLLPFLFFGFVALGGMQSAFAHSTSTSYLLIAAPRADGPVEVRWDLAIHDIVWNVLIDQDYDGVVTWQEILDSRARYIEPAVLGQLSLQRGGAACSLRVTDVALAERAGVNHLSVVFGASCAKPGLLLVGGPLFLGGDASQRVLVSLTRGENQLAGVIGAETPSWAEPERPSAWASFARFVGEGVWHVLIGYDHVAFVLLLLLPSVLRPVDGRWQGATRLSQVTRDIVTIVTAFTVAHSTTLALAVTGTVHLPPNLSKWPSRRPLPSPPASTCCRACRACVCRWHSVLASYTALDLPTPSVRSMPEARRCCHCWRVSISAWRSPSSPSWRWCCRSSIWRAEPAGTPRA